MQQKKQPKVHRPKKTIHGACGEEWSTHQVVVTNNKPLWVCPPPRKAS